MQLCTSCRNAIIIDTPAVYPRLIEFLHYDIHTTGQKSHCFNMKFSTVENNEYPILTTAEALLAGDLLQVPR